MDKNKLSLYWLGLLVAVVMAFSIIIVAGCRKHLKKDMSAQMQINDSCFMIESFI